MKKYELVQIDTFVHNEVVIARSNQLEFLRKYAMETYSSNSDPEYDRELKGTNEERWLYYYSNRGGQYQGSGYLPHALIRLASEEDIIII